ncbi:MAG TPA: hotdog fold thioesterase [Acidimicrobiia bacterium]|nr:hotdog fold thioesterase [Acidimicrobiia bacterium]
MIDQARVEERLNTDEYAAMLGIRLVEVSDDAVTVAMTVTDQMTNFHGATHGGAIFSLADCALSLYANSYPEDASAIDTHMVFSAGSRSGDELTATATEVHRGRTLATYRILVRRTDGKIVGHFTGTVYINST